ncbi:MAG: hypothetical protein FWE52_00285 [Alphaproteobacteria bacterium]|nr:hypothetical protein [Alphaproteobacteria bacterium]
MKALKRIIQVIIPTTAVAFAACGDKVDSNQALIKEQETKVRAGFNASKAGIEVYFNNKFNQAAGDVLGIGNLPKNITDSCHVFLKAHNQIQLEAPVLPAANTAALNTLKTDATQLIKMKSK